MARSRSVFKIPFIKFKINKNTLFNIFGLFLLGIALVLALSFLQNGEILTQINLYLVTALGGFAFFSSIIVLLFSTHFFSTKKLKIIRINISLGLFLIYVSLLGLLQSGEYGQLIFSNLTQDFSSIGGISILSLIFLIGLILFLDTSIDGFILFVIAIFKALFYFIKNNIFRETLSNDKADSKYVEDNRSKKTNKDTEYITDKKTTVQPTTYQQAPLPLADNEGLHIRTLPKDMKKNYVFPPLSLLSDVNQKEAERGDVKKNASIIEKTLDSFGIDARVEEVNKGPTVTQYALKIPHGIKLSKITTLADNLALALAAKGGLVRIEAPIPGRALIGIEIPNIKAEIVTLKRMLSSDLFQNDNNPLLVPLGLDVSGEPLAAQINKFPHALVAGTTGSGKSVMLNAWICSFLFRSSPEDLRMIMVDPKRVELTIYNGIPHLLTEVISEPEKSISALKWTAKEMENRYKIFAQAGAKNIDSYNAMPGVEKKPYIIFIIDELATLMIFAAGEAETLITRLAQMSRAVGIHLILATQRPSVDVITGLMKANIPTRIAFNVPSLMDSRVVLDTPGAEKLLGRGDMLYQPFDQPKPRRVQGPFITEQDVSTVVDFLKRQNPPVHYTEEVTSQDLSDKSKSGLVGISGSHEGKDEFFSKALEIIMTTDKIAASQLQRKFSIGYNRAGKIIDQLEADGYVGPQNGSKPRQVLRRPAAMSSTEGQM
jgi:S-DNA-T family DNA segregation ATPase FtsK/SpoIIIE